MKKLILFSLMILSSFMSFSQISGKIVDADSNQPLPGATILVQGTDDGVVTDFDGEFTIQAATAGSTLVISYLGYETQEVIAQDGILVVALALSAESLDEIILTSGVIDLAEMRATPIAVSTIKASEIALKVGNMEFPEIMNTTPGVYATKQGGGYGDSRISLRGFDQTNTSFLINGQPVNDMEN